MLIRNLEEKIKKLNTTSCGLTRIRNIISSFWVIMILLFLYDRDLFIDLISGRNFFSIIILTIALQIEAFLYRYSSYYKKKRMNWEYSVNLYLDNLKNYKKIRNYFIILMIFDLLFEIFFGWTQFFSIIIEFLKDYFSKE